MGEKIGIPSSWKGTKTREEAFQLIDYGVMLKWRDMRTLKRSFSEEDQVAVVRHFAGRMVERRESRLQAEILVESAMIWLAHAANEKLLHAFLEEFFAAPGCEEASWTLVEIALTGEVSEFDHDLDIYEMAVALICELGTSVQEYDRTYPDEFEGAQGLLDHIATYLLSVSNTNSSCIRLSLLHYFGVTEHGKTNKDYFNRIMSRFGHTVLDHLFTLLFRKRSEAVALQYLLENLPYVLEADDRHSQKIVHETFKFYMLKQPERFSLFIQAFADELKNNKDDSYKKSREVFLQHVGALLQVASEVNHKHLGREFLTAIMKFRYEPFCEELVNHIINDTDIRKPFKDLLVQIKNDGNTEDVIEAAAQFRSSKRGRKPSFSRAEGVGTMHQVTYLGGIEIPKAS